MKNLYFGFNHSMKPLLLIVVCSLLVQGCATVSKDEKNAELMYIKASALTKLSAAVEATVHYDAPDEIISDQELLRRSTEDDPTLLDPFTGYQLKVNRDFGHAIVLMCNQDGTMGLLEDAGCTAKMDEYLWDKVNACRFTISSSVVCAQ